MSELTLERQTRRRHGIDSRDFVQQVGKPHELGVVRHIHTPNRIVDQLTTDSHLVSDGFLTIVHDGTANVEILVKGVIQVQSQQCLALHVKGVLVLK